MKRFMTVILMGALAAIFIGFVREADATDYLVDNYDFENTPLTANWEQWGQQFAVLDNTPGLAFSGSQCVKLLDAVQWPQGGGAGNGTGGSLRSIFGLRELAVAETNVCYLTFVAKSAHYDYSLFMARTLFYQVNGGPPPPASVSQQLICHRDQWRRYWVKIGPLPAQVRITVAFNSKVGAIWMDDVRITTDTPPPPSAPQPANAMFLLSKGAGENLYDNSSFEGMTTDDWIMLQRQLLERPEFWGVIDNSTAAHGNASLKIELSPENYPPETDSGYVPECGGEKYFPIIYLSSLRWLHVTEESDYVFSLYGKGDTGKQILLMVVDNKGISYSYDSFGLNSSWQRKAVQIRLQPGYYRLAVGIGDWGPSGRVDVLDGARAVFWLDGLSVVKGTADNGYAPKSDLELEIATGYYGNILSSSQPAFVYLPVINGSDSARDVSLELNIRKYVSAGEGELVNQFISTNETIAPRSMKILRTDLGKIPNGVYKADAKLYEGANLRHERSNIRIGVVQRNHGLNPILGNNSPTYCNSHLRRLAGARYERYFGAQWSIVDGGMSDDGTYHLAYPDSIVNQYNDGFTKLIFCLFDFSYDSINNNGGQDFRRHLTVHGTDTNGDGTKDEPGIIQNQAFRDRYSAYIRELALRYGDNVCYEIMNELEPSLWGYGMTVRAHAEYIKLASQAIKAVAPNAVVIAGTGQGWANGAAPGSYIEQLFQQGVLNYVDAVTVHPSPDRHPEFDIIPLLNNMNALLDEYDPAGRVKIINTEGKIGGGDVAMVNPQSRPFSETVHAFMLARYYLSHRIMGVEHFSPLAGPGNMINMHESGNKNYPGGAPKPAYASAAFTGNLLGHVQLGERIAEPNPDIFRYPFVTQEGVNGEIIWTLVNIGETYSVPAGKILLDIYGNVMTNNGPVSIQESPVFIFDGECSLADLTPPAFTTLTSAPLFEGIKISWGTDEDATGMVEYWLEGAADKKMIYLDEFVLSRAVEITDLQNNSTYNYQVTVYDRMGNRTASGINTTATPHFDESALINTAGWTANSPAIGEYYNEYDSGLGEVVLTVDSHVGNDFAIHQWVTTDAYLAYFGLKTRTDAYIGNNISFEIYGEDGHVYYLLYVLNTGSSLEYEVTGNGAYISYYITANANEWKFFSRNLDRDFYRAKGIHLDSIMGVDLRGDIQLAGLKFFSVDQNALINTAGWTANNPAIGEYYNEYDPVLGDVMLAVDSHVGSDYAIYKWVNTYSPFVYFGLKTKTGTCIGNSISFTLRGADGSVHYLQYVLNTGSSGYYVYGNGTYVDYYVSANANEWKSFSRNLDRDLYKATGVHLSSTTPPVMNVQIRGDLSVGKLEFFNISPTSLLNTAGWTANNPAIGEYYNEYDPVLEEVMLAVDSYVGNNFAIYKWVNTYSPFVYFGLKTKTNAYIGNSISFTVWGADGSVHYLQYVLNTGSSGYYVYGNGTSVDYYVSANANEWKSFSRSLDQDLYQATGVHLSATTPPVMNVQIRGDLSVGKLEFSDVPF